MGDEKLGFPVRSFLNGCQTAGVNAKRILSMRGLEMQDGAEKSWGAEAAYHMRGWEHVRVFVSLVISMVDLMGQI